MFISDSLFEARQHGRQLQAEAAGERLRTRLARHLLAEALRGAANRLDARPVIVSLSARR
jgi:hypothetical protein